jgi:hypothetical protein
MTRLGETAGRPRNGAATGDGRRDLGGVSLPGATAEERSMGRIVLVTVTLALAAVAGATAAQPVQARHFENMRYFILDAARQDGAERSHAYVLLIGHPEGMRVHVHYDGGAAHLARTHRRRQLVAYFKHDGSVVGRVAVADLTAARGAVRIDIHRDVTLTAPFWDVDEVEARIEG